MPVIRTAAASVTFCEETRIRIRRNHQAADQQAQGETQRQNCQRLAFADALRDQVLGEPVPDPHFARDVQEQQQGQQVQGGFPVMSRSPRT